MFGRYRVEIQKVTSFDLERCDRIDAEDEFSGSDVEESGEHFHTHIHTHKSSEDSFGGSCEWVDYIWGQGLWEGGGGEGGEEESGEGCRRRNGDVFTASDRTTDGEDDTTGACGDIEETVMETRCEQGDAE